MGFNYRKNIYPVSKIDTADGVTTLTVDPTFKPEVGEVYYFPLTSAIPCGVDCSRIVITAGTATATTADITAKPADATAGGEAEEAVADVTGGIPVFTNCGNYWMPISLIPKSCLVMRYYDTPSHFFILSVKRRLYV